MTHTPRVPDGGAPGFAPATAAEGEADERYHALLERAGFGLCRVAPDGHVTSATAEVARLLGYGSRHELAGLHIARDVHADPEDWTVRRGRAGVAAFGEWEETRWRTADQTPVAVRLAMRAVPDGAGGIAWHELLVEDVTERLRQDEILRRSERMATVGTTLAGVAHELNNPLAAIMGFAQLLLRKPLDDDDRASVETINQEAVRASRIVKDLLTLSRTREAERRAPMNLNDIVGYIVRTRRYALEAYGIACDIHLDPTIAMVRGDRAQLEQVVLNLLSNAEQALRAQVGGVAPGEEPVGERARVTVRTRQESDSVILEVADTGPGLPSGDETRIWDPFWTTRGEGQGTGLGLTVVHGIVTDHGGTISAENAPGGGARFIVALPALAARGTASRGGPTATPLDVLVVETDAGSLNFLARFLTSRGHALHAIAEFDQAVKLSDRIAFDAVICGANLSVAPEEVVQRLRATPGCRDARIAVAGAHDTAAVVRAGGIPIARPFDIDTLRRTLEDE